MINNDEVKTNVDLDVEKLKKDINNFVTKNRDILKANEQGELLELTFLLDKLYTNSVFDFIFSEKTNALKFNFNNYKNLTKEFVERNSYFFAAEILNIFIDEAKKFNNKYIKYAFSEKFNKHIYMLTKTPIN